MVRLGIGGVLGCFLASTAHAATFQVEVGGLYPDLASAIAAASAGDTIEMANGDYSGDGTTVVDKGLTITGTGTATALLLPPIEVSSFISLSLLNAQIPCTTDRPGVDVGIGATLILDNGDARYCTGLFSRIEAAQQASVVVTNSTFLSLSAESGAAIRTTGLGSLTIVNSTFTNNIGGQVAGASCDPLWCAGAVDGGLFNIVNVSTSEFAGNEGVLGGGLFAYLPTALEVSDTIFQANSADQGGALFVQLNTAVALSDISILDNFTSNGAALEFVGQDGSAALSITHLVAEDNLRTGAIGPAVISATSVDDIELRSSWFCNNVGDDVWLDDGSALDARGTVFAKTLGAASIAAVNGSTANIVNATFVEQQALALYVDGTTATATISVENTLFYDIIGLVADSTNAISNDIAGLDTNWSFGSLEGPDHSVIRLNQQVVDPLLVSPIGSCSNINLWLQQLSPLRNAGDLAIMNLDGSVSDVGGYGGPWAWLDDQDGDGFYEDLDCLDDEPTAFPGGIEIPNDGIDQDCLDGDLIDGDLDGFTGDVDCADDDATRYPGAPEIPYDNIDQDCDGLDLTDQDGDEFDAIAAGGTDCNDLDSAIWPGTVEIWYDGIDQNCDQQDDFDQDLDGYSTNSPTEPDCDDVDPQTHPNAPEIWYDGTDQNCDDWSDYDQDGDGENLDGFSGADCDDTDPERSSGFAEIPYDGVDQDCDGQDLVDVDGDGAAGLMIGGDDCNDNDPTIFPGAVEDGTKVDRNCDGWTDPPGPISLVGCSHTAPHGLNWLPLLALMLLKRRNKSLEKK